MTRLLTVILICISLLKDAGVQALSENPFQPQTSLKGLKIWDIIDPVEVKRLKHFVLETEYSLAVFFAQ
jgi:hypothetical protein